MPRKRIGTVLESSERLRELERYYEGEPQEIRIKVLRFIKEDPSRTAEEISQDVGCSERSVRRWWGTYTTGGLAALLELNTGSAEQMRALDRKELELIGKKMKRGDFSDIEDVRSWIGNEYGVAYSRSEILYLMNEELGIQTRWTLPSQVNEDDLLLPPHTVRFLNSLPLTDDTNEWINSFRDGLKLLFSEVDHIVVNVRQTCDLRDPKSYKPDIGITQHIRDIRERSDGVVVTTHLDQGRQSERLLEEFRRQRKPLDMYHPPHGFDYYYAGYAYLGTLFFFRELKKPPLSRGTLNTIDALEPFFIYALSNHVMWYQKTRPTDQIFIEGIANMVREGQLSIQEKRVAIYHLLGYSHEEMAEVLAISVNTVKKHINTIHRKTGTRHQRELFARYLTPRIGLDLEKGE